MRTHIMHVVAAAAVTGTLTLLGLAGAGAAVVPASAARPAHPVTAYVVNFNNGAGTVTPIRTATNTALKPVKVGTGPGTIAITPDGKTAYVVNTGAGTVTPIRTATNTTGKAIAVGKHPIAIAITP